MRFQLPIMLGCTWYRAASSAIVPSPRIAARATLALKSGEKLRRFAIVVRSSHQRKYHLTTLSEFWGPLLFDGERLNLIGELAWNPSTHFRSSIRYDVNDVDLPQGDFAIRLVRLKLEVIFSSEWSWVNLIQYDNVTDTAGINSRLHWIPVAGREAFVVLNHNLEDRNQYDDFHSTLSDLAIKFNYTFRF